MYSIKFEDGQECKKAKGIVYNVTQKDLRHEMYKTILETGGKNQLTRYLSKPYYISSKIFNENLVAVHSIKKTVKLDKPVYVGFCILDISKTLMYDFHYGFIKKLY